MKKTVLLFTLMIIFGVAGKAFAIDVTLAWDSNSDADYYIVYWGQSSGNYTQNSGQIPAGTTNYQVKGLDTIQWYFAVKAFNACGNASEFSEEVSNQVTSPQVTPSLATVDNPAQPPQADAGDNMTVDEDAPVTLKGDGPVPDASVSLFVDVDDKPSIEVFDKNFNHYAWLKTGWDDYNNANGEVRVVTGDIDGDNRDEVIIGLGPVPGFPGVPGGYFQILDDDYTHMMWGRINWDEYNDANGETWPTCGDIDGDGVDEIVVGLGKGGEGAIEIFKLVDGELIHYDWTFINWPEYNTSIGETRPACGDIDGDGRDEIVVGLGQTGAFFEDAQISFEVIDDDLGHLSWGTSGWPAYNIANGETWPSCGDIHDDGIDEIVVGFGVGGDGRIEVFEFIDGAPVHLSWVDVNWPEYNQLSGETRPVFGNVDDDPMAEIIVGLGPVSFQDDMPGGLLQVFDDDFSLLRSEKISWTDFNTINGESRPVRSSIKSEGNILISLGPNNVAESSGETQSPGEMKTKAAASDPAASGPGCFIVTAINP